MFVFQAMGEGFLFAMEKCLFPNVTEQDLKTWEVFMLKVFYHWDKGWRLEQEKTTQQNTEGTGAAQSPVNPTVSPKDSVKSNESGRHFTVTVVSDDLNKEQASEESNSS